MRNAGVGLSVVAVVLAGSTWGGDDDSRRPRHLIYLHGRIVQEEQSTRPKHPRFGYYELEKILGTFRDRGFVVSGGIRPKSATVSESADRVVEQIRRLLGSGVPADHITVVGGSMGAAIALLASARLQNPEVRFCALGGCLVESVRGLIADEGNGPSGQVLSIREASDDLAGPCPPWKNDLEAGPPLVAREIVLRTGLSHGFLYRPLPEWVDPVVEWARGAGRRQAPGEPAAADGASRRR
jgi:pimeloyl-ACP methyl ester carboxylesterase